jgi:hypothetical protein
VVNNAGGIFYHNGNQYVQYPGKASDIGVGANGSVWIIGTTPAFGGYGVHRLRNNAWEQIDGAGTNIAVNPYGMPWVTNSATDIYKRY